MVLLRKDLENGYTLRLANPEPHDTAPYKQLQLRCRNVTYQFPTTDDVDADTVMEMFGQIKRSSDFFRIVKKYRKIA